jgi:hypothetical protein
MCGTGPDSLSWLRDDGRASGHCLAAWPGHIFEGNPWRVNSVSCASAGNCVAGGGYRDSASHDQAFVASEVNGTWHPAIEVPGTATLNTGGNASVSSVSCGSPGNCVAGGFYEDKAGHYEAFVTNP